MSGSTHRANDSDAERPDWVDEWDQACHNPDQPELRIVKPEPPTRRASNGHVPPKKGQAAYDPYLGEDRTKRAASFEEAVQHRLWTYRIDNEARRLWVAENDPHGQELPQPEGIAQLLGSPDEFNWSIKGFLEAGGYGPIGGEKKTFKSYVLMFVSIGLAAGVPVFGQFEVPEPKPVILLVGEGGRELFKSRFRRIAKAMGVNPTDLEVYAYFDPFTLGTDRFNRFLARELEQRRPGLLGIDPLYAFHGGEVDAKDLYKRGALLSSVSRPCVEAGTSLYIPDHWNKSGSGTGLERLSQAAMGEWAHTWLQLSHREPYDIAEGQAFLTMELGSRRWGGSLWDLDLKVGVFDEDVGDHVGDIEWSLQRSTGAESNKSKADRVRLDSQILDVLDDHPYEYTKTEVRKLTGSRRDFDSAWDGLQKFKYIVTEQRERKEARPDGGTRTVTRTVWARRNPESEAKGD